MKKRTLAFLVAAVLMLTLMPLSALAHGHGGGYSLCSVDSCGITGLHRHDGICYAGHYSGDGHDYHQVCTVRGCTSTVHHEHNGVSYLPGASTGRGHHSGRHGGKGHH